MIFRCTKKAQGKLRLAPSDLALTPTTHSLAEWYCNVVTLARRPLFLCTHARSLYAFYLPVAGNSSIESFGLAFRESMTAVLAREGIPAETSRKLLDDGPDQFTKTMDRGVVGTMLDHLNMSYYHVDDAGKLDDQVLDQIHDNINCSPMSVIGMERPRDALRVLLNQAPVAPLN